MNDFFYPNGEETTLRPVNTHGRDIITGLEFVWLYWQRQIIDNQS